MMMDLFRRPAPWQGSRSADMQHALLVEETLANVRLVIILVSVTVAGIEIWRNSWMAASIVLGLMAAYSAVAAVALHTQKIRSARHIAIFHVIDTAGILTALVLTGGALSPFSTLFLFVLLAAGYRWGRQETWLTAAAGIIVLGVHGVVSNFTHLLAPPDLHIVALRLIVHGHRRPAHRLHGGDGAHPTVPGVVRLAHPRPRAGGGGPRGRGAVGARRARRAVPGDATRVLVLEEEGSDRVSLWQAERARDESRRATIRLNQEPRGGNADLPVSGSARRGRVQGAAAGTRTRRQSARRSPRSTPRARAATTRSPSGRSSTRRSSGGRCFASARWRAKAGRGGCSCSCRSIRRWRASSSATCAASCAQVGPALFNLYLQRRLQSRAGVVERARISRELHDGVIQSLIGIEMQLEVMRRETTRQGGGFRHAVSWSHIQRLLSQEILNVRDLMQLLKPAEVDAKQLVEHLADTIERFRHRTGIQARLACDADEIDLTPRVCREVAGIVQEALANVRKHSGATSVVVRLGLCGPNWQLVVDDNGRGLDFEGYLTPEEVEAQRKGPVHDQGAGASDRRAAGAPQPAGIRHAARDHHPTEAPCLSGTDPFAS